MKKVAVLQSNYIPWKGYFDIIHDVDLFIFYDEVQYTKNDWRNRNRILTKTGAQWITVPTGDNIHRSILDVEIKNSLWQKKHWNSIVGSYSRAPYFKKYKEFFEYVYLEKKWTKLYELNRYIIINIASEFLDMSTKFEDSRNFQTEGKKDEKLLSLLKQVKTDIYISGPSASEYMNIDNYKKNDIEIKWKKYHDYPKYRQRYEPFTHYVSIIDLLFNVGENAQYYIWGHRE